MYQSRVSRQPRAGSQAAGGPPVTARTALPLRWALGLGLAYGVLALLARLTVMHGQSLSLVWPGAGIAVLWLLAESPRQTWRVLVPLTVIHAGVVWATAAPPAFVVFGALSVTCQTWVTVALLRRWCPTLLGAEGSESFRSPRTLAYTFAAAALGSAAGAGLGATGVWLEGGPVWEAWVPQAWFARHLTGILAVGCVGHLAWEWRTQYVAPRARGGSRRELALLWVISLVVVGIVFNQPLPLIFLIVPLCVWSASRFSTFLAAAHALALGTFGVLMNLVGDGPASGLDDPLMQVLVGQIFLLAILMTGLTVGTLSDRIDQLVLNMGEARARAAEQAELLAEMTESMDEGLIVLDRHGRIERSNGASRRLAHRVRPGAPDDVALADLVELVLNPGAAAADARRAELGVGDVLVPLLSGDDLVIAVSRTVLASQRGDDHLSGVLLVLTEVTEHRHGLRPLVSFASTAAHDLRGPLTAIRAWLDLAAVDLDDDDDTLVSIKRAERASIQMADLIDDLLTQAVAEAGDLEVHDVELSGSEGVLVRAAALLGPHDAIEVPDAGLPPVHADEVALRQLFANLVGNSVKYARPGVPALVRVTAQRRGSRVVVEVEDNGAGVDEHQRALIFERFHRGAASGGKLGGTGMGLSICQTIVQRHGGSIECLPADPGPGSVFRFDLPAAVLEPVSVLPVPAAGVDMPEELATA